jgi:hypothetical protein
MTLGELSIQLSDFGRTSLSEFFQIITTLTSIGAMYLAARAAFHTKVLKVSINGRMEKLLEATAEAAVARGREEIRAEMILEALKEQSEAYGLCEDNIENARKSGFQDGRLHEVESWRRYRKLRRMRHKDFNSK